MKFTDITKRYKIGRIHSHKHFYGNSFRIISEGNRQIVIARPRKGQKPFRMVAVIKGRKNN